MMVYASTLFLVLGILIILLTGLATGFFAGKIMMLFTSLVKSVRTDKSQQGVKMASKSRSSIRILLVDDEQMVLEYVQLLLEGAGYTVLAADTPQAALQLSSKAEHIDLLVSDVVMPRMSGPELHKLLLESRPGLRVLFMSGYPDVAKSLCGRTDNSVSFIAKPVTSESLLKKVSAALTKK